MSRSLASALALAAALAAPSGAGADPPCVPGSIGPNGCRSIRPEDVPQPRPEVDLSLPTDVPLALPRAEREQLMELRALRRVRPRGDSALPSITEPPAGRDPQALRRFQAPYRLD